VIFFIHPFCLDLQEVAVGFSLPQAATLLGEEEENPGM
jgi:hypothetical protein